MRRETKPCPFYGMPCEYVPMAEKADAAADEIERFKVSLADMVTQTQEQADEIERLRAALRELLWYTNQLEINVYDPDEWPKVHEAVKTARAALKESSDE